MAFNSDFNTGGMLEWYSQLPYINWPRNSQTFLVQDLECYFHFYKKIFQGQDIYYCLDLLSKKADKKLEPFNLVIYSVGYSPHSFVRCEVNSSNTNILCFSDDYLKYRELNFSSGSFVRFLFLFEKDVSSLPLETEIGDRSTQTDIFVLASDEQSTQTDITTTLEDDVENLALDFGMLLKTSDHSDVQLQCKNGKIPAHKSVLAARSKTFSDMFQDNTEESLSGLVNLKIVDISEMELCLEYIYKGNIRYLSVEKVPSIYELGHILKIPSLIKMSADLMACNTSKDNYVPYLVLADKYKDSYFKSRLLDYMYNHIDLLKETGEEILK